MLKVEAAQFKGVALELHHNIREPANTAWVRHRLEHSKVLLAKEPQNGNFLFIVQLNRRAQDDFEIIRGIQIKHKFSIRVARIRILEEKH